MCAKNVRVKETIRLNRFQKIEQRCAGIFNPPLRDAYLEIAVRRREDTVEPLIDRMIRFGFDENQCSVRGDLEYRVLRGTMCVVHKKDCNFKTSPEESEMDYMRA